MPVPIALVTGAPEWVPHVALALKSEGFDVLSDGDVPDGRRSDGQEAPPARGPVDCYVVVGGSHPPSEIAARAPSDGHHRSWRSYLDEEPGLGFADWRDDVLCLTSSSS